VHEYLKVLELHDHEQGLGFLNEVVRRHVSAFSFSSVNCFLGEDLPLDFESLFNRIVVQRRGGYCFEQNGLLFEVLKELGYLPELYLARVIYNQDTHPGLTHRITIVEHEGQKYVLDVGFGPLGPRGPVLFSENETIDGDRRFRILDCHSGNYHMQVFKEGDFFSLYRFELARYGQADCELGHFYSHRHPEASFVNHLVVACLQESETRSLRDLDYRVITGHGVTENIIGSAEQLRRILVDELGMQVTEVESCKLFERLDA